MQNLSFVLQLGKMIGAQLHDITIEPFLGHERSPAQSVNLDPEKQFAQQYARAYARSFSAGGSHNRRA